MDETRLRAAFVSAIPGIAASASAAFTSARAALLNETFAQFVAGDPPLDELEASCKQYLRYAQQETTAGPCGLEAACHDFLSYFRQLRPAREAAPVQIVRRDVQWYSAADVDEVVGQLRAQTVSAVDLTGAPVDAQDSDTISMEAATTLATGLAGCRSTLGTLSLTDMKISTDGLRTVLHSLAGSPVLRRVHLSNLCSRWTVQNTLGSERGELLAELMRGWARLESIILQDCTLADGCMQVVDALRGLGALREVDLTYNELDDAAALVLAKSLEGKTELGLVALKDGNEIGPTGLAAVEATLRASGKLNVLQ